MDCINASRIGAGPDRQGVAEDRRVAEMRWAADWQQGTEPPVMSRKLSATEACRRHREELETTLQNRIVLAEDLASLAPFVFRGTSGR